MPYRMALSDPPLEWKLSFCCSFMHSLRLLAILIYTAGNGRTLPNFRQRAAQKCVFSWTKKSFFQKLYCYTCQMHCTRTAALFTRYVVVSHGDVDTQTSGQHFSRIFVCFSWIPGVPWVRTTWVLFFGKKRHFHGFQVSNHKIIISIKLYNRIYDCTASSPLLTIDRFQPYCNAFIYGE